MVPNEFIRLGDVIELLTDYHANGSYEKLNENVTLLNSEDYAVMIRTTNFEKNDYRGKGVKYIIMYGSLAFIIGLLGQAVGMFSAFAAIQEAGDISPGLIAGGFRVSMIAPLYGVIYFILSIPIWVVLREKIKRR